MTLRAAAEQALEALTNCSSEYGHRCNRCDSEVDEGGSVADALRAALAAEQPQPEAQPVAGWIACSERMPGEGVEVLGYWPAIEHIVDETITATVWRGGDWFDCLLIESEKFAAPSHWMPLPAAPATAPPPSAPEPQPRIDPMQNPLRPTLAKLGPPDEHPAEEVLRKLACWLGVGGYNAPTVDADVFHRKIVDGVESLLAVAARQPSAPEPSRTLTQDGRDVFDAALRRSTKVVAPEPHPAEVEPSATERRLRRLLCLVKHGRSAYMDDGEAQDSSVHPSIDYLRDSLDEIEAKWRQRASAPPPTPEPSEAEVAAAMASLYRAMEPAAWPSEDEVTDALRAAAAARNNHPA